MRRLYLALLFTACEPAADGPCDHDPTGCAAPSGAFERLPTCTAGGRLGLELGQGADAYSPLADGEPPRIYYGSQGGQHLFLGLRVRSVDAELTPALEVHVEVTGDTNGLLGTRRLVLGERRALALTAPDEATEFGIVLVLSRWVEAEDRRITVTVGDQCDRSVTARHEVPARAGTVR